MKTSILHALHVLHGLKIKFAQVISCVFLNDKTAKPEKPTISIPETINQ